MKISHDTLEKINYITFFLISNKHIHNQELEENEELKEIKLQDLIFFLFCEMENLEFVVKRRQRSWW